MAGRAPEFTGDFAMSRYRAAKARGEAQQRIRMREEESYDPALDAPPAASQPPQKLDFAEWFLRTPEPPSPTGAELTNYEPSLRDRLAEVFAGLGEAAGMSPKGSSSWGRGAGGIGDFVPGVGSGLAFNDATRAFDRGDYGEAALNAVGAIPEIGAPLKAMALGLGARKAAKLAKGAKAAEQAVETAPAEFERVYDAQAFHDAISASAAGSKYGPAVEVKAVEEYPKTMMFMTPDRQSGFAIKPGDGDLVSVFSSVKGRLPSIMETANTVGARKLDAFDTSMSGAKQGLPEKYGPYGYVEKERMPWDDQYAPQNWRPDLGRPDNVLMERPEPPRPPPGEKFPVEGTWGKKDRPDITFEGAEPRQFTPGQFGRMGAYYGAHNIGPVDEMAWYHSLQPFVSKSGKTFKVPGGLQSTEPFTYFDDLYMKAQGIDPNDLTPEQHLALHNRTVAGKQAPPGGFSDANIFNQIGGMGLLSPNNPLTPNEFAAAAAMAKGDGAVDLAEIAKAAPGFDYRKHPMLAAETDDLHKAAGRRELSSAITERLGTQAAERGGTGVSGNQDYTTLVGLAQMMRDKPDFFRFRGAGEGSAEASEQWLNFVDRLQTQVPGLQAKTASFGGVWQDPVKAATSAMDRHMLTKFRDDVFETPDEQAAWTDKLLEGWNAQNKPPKKFIGPPEKPVESVDELRTQPGGTGYFNDQIFGYVNRPVEGKMRLGGEVNQRVPEHLRPENADYVHEPLKFTTTGPAYRRGVEANRASGEAAGATGVFSDQWRVWDPLRHRFEPHEINQPGLTKMPRMSERQQGGALQAHDDLGYLNYTKDAKGELQPVRPSTFDPMEKLTPERARMKKLLGGIDPSKLAYWSAVLGLPLSAVAEMLGGEQSQRPEQVRG